MSQSHVRNLALTSAVSDPTEPDSVNDRTHEFVGVQAALHQRLDLVVASECNCLSGRGMTLLCWHKFISRDFYLGPIRCRSDLGGGSDQHGNDEIRFGGLDCAKQGVTIDWMNHGSPERLQGLRLLDEVPVMMATFAKSK